MKRCLPALVLCGGVVASAVGQTPEIAWLLEISSGIVSPSNPSVTVRISARFPRTDYAWAMGNWDVLAGEGTWTDLRLVNDRRYLLLGRVGTPQGGDVVGIDLQQTNIIPGFPANTSNPLLLWQGTWTATSFAPREVRITTHTALFDVYRFVSNQTRESRLSQLVEGEALIRVIPAPAAALPLLAGVLALGRRRGG